MFAGLSLSTCSPYSPVNVPLAPPWRVGELDSAEVEALGDDDEGPAEELVRVGELVSTWLSEVRLLEGESLDLRRSENLRSGLDEDEVDEVVGWRIRGLGELASDARASPGRVGESTCARAGELLLAMVERLTERRESCVVG